MLLVALATAFCVVPAHSAEATGTGSAVQQDGIKVTGTVADAIGGVAGASVMIDGTSTGTITDLDGRYTIDTKTGDVLVFSCIGYKTVKVIVTTQAVINVTLEEDTTLLEEVVVTALGVKRDRKALGYGVAEVKGDELTTAKETNVVNSLAGKVAGLVVQQTAGGASGSTRVMLRGNTEMTGNNQPLYVVDGVPLDNTNFGSAGQAGGYDLGDGISAINPDDIETMTVLKGPAASALYGSRASHGVILITTKKADEDKFSLEYNGSYTFESQLARWDNVQLIYGQGTKGEYSKDATALTNSSWGPKADINEMTYFDGVTRPTLIYPNNASDFFRTGFTAQNSLIFSTNTGKSGIRVSLTDMRNLDILPNSGMSRDNVNLRANTSVGKVDMDFNVTYTREDVKNRPALGDSQSNVGKNLMTIANSFDQSWLKNYQTATGDYANWNGNDQYNKNPYWDLYKNSNKSAKDVFRLTGKLVWNINSHLKIQGTVGSDMNNMEFSDYVARTTPGKAAGQLQNSIFRNRTVNAELLVLYNNEWGNFDFSATAGGNIFNVNNHTTVTTGTTQLMDDIVAIMNYEEQNTQESSYCKQINSLFASASLGYKRTYYLEATVRGDQSSTLPVNNNIYVYPSVSASLVFSNFVEKKNILSFGKIRASYAIVGSDTDPYMLSLNYANGKYSYPGYTIGMINGNIQPNMNLRPTMTSSVEAGLEMKFFNNRLGVDFTYYWQNSKDQIIRLASSSASGYDKRLVNAGQIRNSGVELAINARAVQAGDFAWDLGLNFSKNNNKVIDLVDGMDFFELEKAAWCNVSVGAQKGENFGSIVGPGFLRDEKNRIIVDPETGMPYIDNTTKVLGNASWDWTGGFYTTFSYKGFRLSAAFDVKVGADLYSMSMRSAYNCGKAMETVAGREEWYTSEEQRKAAGWNQKDWINSGHASGYVVEGVYGTKDADGNIVGTEVVNTIPVDPEKYWQMAAEKDPVQFIYDNSYIKCRELTFSYSFPSKWLGKAVKGLNLSFVARNPFIVWKNIPNIDPDSAYNTSGMGLEYGSLPSRRSFGFNIKLNF